MKTFLSLFNMCLYLVSFYFLMEVGGWKLLLAIIVFLWAWEMDHNLREEKI